MRLHERMTHNKPTQTPPCPQRLVTFYIGVPTTSHPSPAANARLCIYSGKHERRRGQGSSPQQSINLPSVLITALVDPKRLVLDLTFASGGPAVDFQRIGELAQVLHDAPSPFEGHLFRNHLLVSFPRGDEERLLASCVLFISTLNHEGRVHRGQLVEAVTREYEHGQVHGFSVHTASVPGIVVSNTICDKVHPELRSAWLLRWENVMLIRPFAVTATQETEERRTWIRECRSALQRTASSPDFECSQFDWLISMLDAVGRETQL